MAEAQKSGNIGVQKAAALLLSLGVDRSSAILRHLGEPEMERVLIALSESGAVPADIRHQVLKEAQAISSGGSPQGSGGIELTRQLLARSVDARRGAEILDRISARQNLSSFEIVRNADPAQVATLLQDEHPQAIALVLAHLDTKLAADILTHMPAELQADITLRLARMDRISPQVVQAVERGLKRKLSSVFSDSGLRTTGGVPFLVKVLNQVDRGVQKTIFESLEASNSELVDEVRASMFTFDDLVKLDDRSMQRLMRDVNKQDLTLALKGAPENIREMVFRNISERARENLQEELDLLGPQLAKNVYGAQRRIVDVVRSLVDSEEIVLAGSGGGDEIIP